MKKAILFMAIIVPFFFSPATSFSDETKRNVKEEDTWELYSRKGEFLGNVKKEKERFIFYDKDEINFKEKDENAWEMYNREDEFVGTLKREKDKFRIYDKHEKYLGLILESKRLMPRGHVTRITQLTPEAAKLYLDVLEAIEKIKQ